MKEKIRGSKLSHEFDIAYKKWLKRRGLEDHSEFKSYTRREGNNMMFKKPLDGHLVLV